MPLPPPQILDPLQNILSTPPQSNKWISYKISIQVKIPLWYTQQCGKGIGTPDPWERRRNLHVIFQGEICGVRELELPRGDQSSQKKLLKYHPCRPKGEFFPHDLRVICESTIRNGRWLDQNGHQFCRWWKSYLHLRTGCHNRLRPDILHQVFHQFLSTMERKVVNRNVREFLTLFHWRAPNMARDKAVVGR